MKRMHHANLVNWKGDVRSHIFGILESDLDFSTHANPDFLLLETESFGIDNARQLEDWAIGKPLVGGTKASVILARSITHEAQNALLKVLEEPPLGTYIFMSFQNVGNLLPTFHSRIRVLDTQDDEGSSEDLDKQGAEAKKFLDGGIKGKLAIIRSLSKKEDKEPMRELIKNLEAVSYKEYSKSKDPDLDDAARMKKALMAKIFAASRGSSPKMLLEWLSCVI